MVLIPSFEITQHGEETITHMLICEYSQSSSGSMLPVKVLKESHAKSVPLI